MASRPPQRPENPLYGRRLHMPPGRDDEVGVYTCLLRLLARGHTRSPAE